MEFRSFEELFEIPLRNGLTKPKNVRGEGYKMVNMGELFAFPRINNVPMDRVPLTIREKEASTLVDGDLLFARQSLVREGAGQCSIFVTDNEEVCFESHIIRCRLNQKVANPFFYYYFFRSNQGKQVIDAIIEQGAGASGIRGSDLAKLQVPYIEKEIQDEIAAQLNTIDNKIELNRQINKTLEEIAQAIFKSWFVDFEPVKAKIEARQSLSQSLSQTERDLFVERAAMRAISGKTDEELDKLTPEQLQQLSATAALFPDELVDSELGEIPKGWRVGIVGDFMDFNPKRNLKKGTVAPYLDMKNMPHCGHLANDIVPREFGSGSRFVNGDTLLARITPCLENGKTAFVDFLKAGEVGWGSTEYIVMRSKDDYPECFTYLIARHEPFRQFAIRSMMGTSGRQRASADALEKMPWVVPEKRIANAFGKIVKQIMVQIKLHGDSNKTLVSLRDSLLPKLLSGELSVTQAEQAMEDAACA